MSVPSTASFVGVDTTSLKTITMPLTSLRQGRVITFKDKTGNAATNAITLVTAGPDTFEGNKTQYLINTPYGSVTFISKGTVWFVMNVNLPATLSNLVSTANLANFVSTANLANLVSTANLANLVSTANLAGHVSTANLANLVSTTYLASQFGSTVIGLGTAGYVSSIPSLAGLVSTANLVNLVSTANLANLVSTSYLNTQLGSTMNGISQNC